MFDTISNIWERISAPFSAVADFVGSGLLGWMLLGSVIIVGCFVAGWFFARARPWLGVVAISVISFIGGGVKMWLKTRDKRKEQREEPVVQEAQEEKPGWRFPWWW
jgi:hypothetical protein